MVQQLSILFIPADHQQEIPAGSGVLAGLH
jgi:hypothetical protein